MELTLTWHRPLPIKEAKPPLIYWVDLSHIPKAPGVYVFYRVFGRRYSALYVGQAQDLAARLKYQLNNNLRLMMGLRDAASGPRHLIVGELKRPGTGVNKKLRLIERTLIRHFQLSTDGLLNVHGTKIVEHTLTSDRKGPGIKHFIPPKLYFEK
jgi:hypothetical protein